MGIRLSEKPNIRVRDPVCGKDLDLAEAAAMVDHHGWAHFFCSTTCRDAFCANPGRFAEDRARHRPPRNGDGG
jgi:Cu+-exporting ATPase